jgi:hypothetical protein
MPGSGLFLGGLGTTHAYPRYPDEPLAFFESSESAAHEVDVTTVPFNLARLRKSGQQAVMIQLPEQRSLDYPRSSITITINRPSQLLIAQCVPWWSIFLYAVIRRT